MIECTKLTKRFGSLTALDALTLSIGEGEIFGFIGPNGAGKSTTMKILSCLLTQAAGTATVANPGGVPPGPSRSVPWPAS